MDDSDEYLYDDFVLDEQAIAALDQAEQNYQNSLPKPLGPTEPVNKRHKTDIGWKAGPGANYLDDDNFDDLPEISVRDDGSYSIRSATNNQMPEARTKAKERHSISAAPSVRPSSLTSHPSRYKVSKPLIPSLPGIHSKAVVQEAMNKSKEHVASGLGQSSQLEKQFKELKKSLEEVSIDFLSFKLG
jgi:hypothetical protein